MMKSKDKDQFVNFLSDCKRQEQNLQFSASVFLMRQKATKGTTSQKQERNFPIGTESQ